MLINRILLIVVIVFTSASASLSGEFGNRWSTQEEEKSRQAGAEALMALEQVFIALRERELKQFERGKLSLGKASMSFLSSAKEIREIYNSIDANSDNIIIWDEINRRDRAIVGAMISILDKKNLPEKLSDLYGAFADATERLGNILKDFESSNEEPILPKLVDEIVLYIHIGNVVSKIGRQLS